jgi:hypothetical protein
MAAMQVVLPGVLKSDGSLELSQRPTLPAGAVEVTIRTLERTGDAEGDWWQYLQRIRAELEAAGHPFRTQSEIDADLEELRGGDERIEQLYSRTERTPGGN